MARQNNIVFACLLVAGVLGRRELFALASNKTEDYQVHIPRSNVKLLSASDFN